MDTEHILSSAEETLLNKPYSRLVSFNKYRRLEWLLVSYKPRWNTTTSQEKMLFLGGSEGWFQERIICSTVASDLARKVGKGRMRWRRSRLLLFLVADKTHREGSTSSLSLLTWDHWGEWDSREVWGWSAGDIPRFCFQHRREGTHDSAWRWGA